MIIRVISEKINLNIIIKEIDEKSYNDIEIFPIVNQDTVHRGSCKFLLVNKKYDLCY